MLYLEDGTLYMPLNHYEIYYNISDSVLPSSYAETDAKFVKEARETLGTPEFLYGKMHESRRKMADNNNAVTDEPHAEYRVTREQLGGVSTKKFRDWNALYGRL